MIGRLRGRVKSSLSTLHAWLKSRLAKIRTWLSNVKEAGRLAIIVSIILAVAGELYLNIYSGDSTTWFYSLIKDFCANFTTSLFFIGVAILWIDSLVERQQEERDKRRLKRRASSRINAIAVDAVEEMSLNGWLQKGLLSKAILYEANLSNASLDGADLSGANFFNANLTGATFVRATLVGTTFFNANLTGAIFLLADVSGADFSMTNLKGAKLKEATLVGAEFFNANLTGAEFFNSNLTGADLTGANLTGADLSRANLTGANLSRADLTGANLTGANLSEALFLTKQQIAKTCGMSHVTMSDKTRYDGRYNLKYDIDLAIIQFGEIKLTPEEMALFYEVPLKEYLKGQDWAKDNLEKLKAEIELS
jgi:uncharacterized protein YjbI with pentapeptide repeats